MDEEYPLVHSPLARSLTEDGHTVQIEIYRGEDSDWVLEVVDEHNNSTVWDDQFSSDQAALDEAVRTVREEGIESLVDSSSSGVSRT